LTVEDQEILKKIEEAGVDEEVVKSPKTSDEKYSYYYTQGYIIDPSIGLIYTNYELISKQRRLVFTLLKQVGKNILSGRSIMNISFPVYVFEPYSLLDRFVSLYTFVPTLLSPITTIKDPIERMKVMVTWVIASMHLGISQYKPFNPILGETLEATLNKYKFYGEQISHHPPISSIMVVGKDLKVCGLHGIVANTYPNSATATTNGKRVIKVGGEWPVEYEVTHPQTQITGLMLGKRTFNYAGCIRISDESNELYAIVSINPTQQGFFSSLFYKKEHRDDYIKGFITKDKNLVEKYNESLLNKEGHLSYFEGYWIEELKIDGKLVWSIDNMEANTLISPADKLLSDSSLRPDLLALKNNDEAESQRQKDILEEIQRDDRKLRANAKKK
jgi:hypothetical protein